MFDEIKRRLACTDKHGALRLIPRLTTESSLKEKNPDILSFLQATYVGVPPNESLQAVMWGVHTVGHCAVCNTRIDEWDRNNKRWKVTCSNACRHEYMRGIDPVKLEAIEQDRLALVAKNKAKYGVANNIYGDELVDRVMGAKASIISQSKKPYEAKIRDDVYAATNWMPSDFPLKNRMLAIMQGVAHFDGVLPDCRCGTKLSFDLSGNHVFKQQYCSYECSRKYSRLENSADKLANDAVDKLYDYDWMNQKRIIERKSAEDIADELGVSSTVVRKAFSKIGIESVKLNWTESVTPEEQKQRNLSFSKSILGEETFNLLYNTSFIFDENTTNGKSIYSMAYELGVSEITIKTAATHLGIELVYADVGTSAPEMEMFNFIKRLRQSAIPNYKKFSFTKKELDVYIPELNLGVEFNGAWHHSSPNKNSDYHKNKVNLFYENGIRIIQIWEDDWATNRMVVEYFLRMELMCDTINNHPKITVDSISKEQYMQFLINNHIRGYVSADKMYGSFVDGVLCAVMGLVDNAVHGYQEIVAFSSKANDNLFDALLNHVKFLYNTDIYGFADLEIDCIDSNRFTKNGFISIGHVEPEPTFIHASSAKRNSKITVPNVLSKDCTESDETMKKLKYHKCYDSGKIRYHLPKSVV